MADAALTAAALQTNAHAVQMPYLMLAGVFALLAIFFVIMKLPKIVEEPREPGAKHEGTVELFMKTLKYPHLALGVLGIFFYVGGEVAIGSFLVNYMKDLVGFTAEQAGKFLMFYWGGAMVGRFIGAAILRFIKPSRVLAFNATIVCLLLVVTMVTKGHVAMWSVLGDRPFQLHHVPHDLHARHCETGTPYQLRFRPALRGDCRRRACSAAYGKSRRHDRTAFFLFHPAYLLSVHFLLRLQRVHAQAAPGRD